MRAILDYIVKDVELLFNNIKNLSEQRYSIFAHLMFH